MPTIHQDSESFHHFAIVRLARAAAVQSFDELFVEWRDSQSQDEINEAIRCGLADIEAGDTSRPKNQPSAFENALDLKLDGD